MTDPTSPARASAGSSSSGMDGDVMVLPGTRPFPTPLLGRETDLERTEALLDSDTVRVLTLTGPGGIGKTRLAIETAARLQAQYAHGAHFVSLAAVRDAAKVPHAIGDALGIRESAGSVLTDQLVNALRGQHLLLVLDNMEQVTEAAVWLADFLGQCPRIKVIVTSRAVLHLQSEQHYPVPPLMRPPGRSSRIASLEEAKHYPSVRLFVERARAVQPGFALTTRNVQAVSDICARLEGVPLAIELAAARVNVLTPAQMLVRLSDRLALLRGNMRDAPLRLQTMRNAIAWSYDLLGPEEQMVFRRVAVFVSGFTLEAAEAVAVSNSTHANGSDLDPVSVLEHLSALVDQSLIEPLDHEEETRFRMLEIIREFGLAQLEQEGESEVVAERHASWFLRVVERITPMLTGPDQVQWLNRLEAMYDDIRHAYRWMFEQGEFDRCLRLVNAVWPFIYTRGHYSEARAWLEELLGQQLPPSPERVEALNAAGILASLQGDVNAATALHEEARRLSTDLEYALGLAFAMNGLGIVAEEVEDDPSVAYQRYSEARDLFRDLGEERAVAVMLTNLGNLSWDDPTYESAIANHTEASRIFQKIGNPRGVAWSATNLGAIAIQQGRLTDAADRLRVALRAYRDLGDQSGIIETLERFADIARAQGERERQVQLLGAAANMRESISFPIWASDREAYDATLAELLDALGPSFDALWRTGRSMQPDDVIALAMSPDPTSVEPVVAPPEREDMPAHDLSPRELEVLQLMADGLSNREIADRLFISQRTVTSHTSNILGKLQVTTRTAAVAFAIRNDLVS